MKAFLKDKKFLFALGLILFLVCTANALMITFAFRDFSFYLFLEFLVAMLVYPFSIYLLIKNKPVFTPSLIAEGEGSTLHHYDADGNIKKVE